MKIIKIVSEKFGQNNYLIDKDNTAVLIDASATVSQIEENLNIDGSKAKLVAIILTHEHFDHIAQLDNLIAKYDCPVYIHSSGKPNLYVDKQNLSILDTPFKIKNKRNLKIFKDGDELKFNGIEIKCYHTPGHSMGSSCFVIDNNMFVGDTIFKVDIGRNDLYGGDENIQKITLMRLRDELSEGIDIFYPGHGANFNLDDLKYNLEHYLGEN